MTCKDCVHYEACKSMLEAMGYLVDGDGLDADEKCETFQSKKDVVPRDEYESLLRRFRHLLESDYIRSFDEVDRRTGEYKRDIKEAAPVVHGRWIYHNDDLFPIESMQECSRCHEKEFMTLRNENFCTNCGAKMDLQEGGANADDND
ncbi:MAG: hypothetical protein ACI4Q7_05015 [Candidatus Avelusimicrobium sp.]